MIDVRELRVGSYISGKQINIFRVDEIRIKDGLYTLRMYIGQLGGHTWLDILPGNAEPIELTEDILLKCGFEINKGSFDTKVATLKSYTPDASPISIVIYGAGKMVGPAILYGKTTRILHIHQLQNIYFDLTGKELKVTLQLSGS